MFEKLIFEVAKQEISLTKYLSDFSSKEIVSFRSSLMEQNYCENVRKPVTGGTWDGNIWKPNQEVIPDPDNRQRGNPEGKTWGQILDKYEIAGIEFKNGYPDFSSVMESEVTIDDFGTDRRINFNQADMKQADVWNEQGKDGKTDWQPGDVSRWRKDNNYTWHECEDCKTMQLVPSEIHNNIPHEGGIAVAKKSESNK